MKKRSNTIEYRVVAAYDTETTNIGSDERTKAYTVLYILNDLRNVDLRSYTVDDPRERIRFTRTVPEFMTLLSELVGDGVEHDYVPVVAAYNLMFDMQTLMHALANRFVLRVNAQSSTHVYTIDLYPDKDAKTPVMRFWDTFFLEMNGLAAMGDTAGVPKAVGDWDYTLTRTPETPLSDSETHYASRDVQVIPAYLRYLLDANPWLEPGMFGNRVLTKTSLVRQMARFEIGGIELPSKRQGRKRTLETEFRYLCMREFPNDYDTYALRKACFRGGFTFTSASFASRVMHNVASLDVTSMHHTFINGRRVPVRFQPVGVGTLRDCVRHVCSQSLKTVMDNYAKPFLCAFHMCVVIRNIRLRSRSPFERYGIGLIPRGKFGKRVEATDVYDRPDEQAAENGIRARGYIDTAEHPVFAFGKLMSADSVVMYVNEVELWTMWQVYEWDSLTPLFGEATTSTILPPAYVSLQSNVLFRRKSDVKRMTKLYDGTPFTGDIPDSIPTGIADKMRDGTLDVDFLTAYYQGTVKGQFNSIYGTMAQDLLKPGYIVAPDGSVVVDENSVATPENYAKLKPRTCKVMYTYGMRIVAGSRMHLVIAIMLLWEALGERAKVTGGDTDSLKVACDADVTDGMLSDAVQPLLDAATVAMDACQYMIRKQYPNMSSDLKHIGGFEVENAGDHYVNHMELWNKARVSEDVHGRFHVTMAGLSRPRGTYHIEHWMCDMRLSGFGFGDIVAAIGYSSTITAALCHSMQRTNPKPDSVFDSTVTDYRGVSVHVRAPEAIGLYPAARRLGELDKAVNWESLEWLRRHGVEPYHDLHVCGVDETGPYVADFDGVRMRGEYHGLL